MAQRGISSDGGGVGEAEKGDETAHGREALGFFLGYISYKEKRDPDASFPPEVRSGLEQEKAKDAGVGEVDFATEQGAKLGSMGDVLHGKAKQIARESVSDLMKMSRENAFKRFKEIAKDMFKNRRGETVVNGGRVLMFLEFCYELCVAYIKKETGYDVKDAISFIIGVASSLLIEFVRYKVLEWIKSRGGWGWLIKFVEIRRQRMLLLVGVVSLSLWVVSYFWG